MELRANSAIDMDRNPNLRDALIEVIGEGLPLVKRPYAEIALRLNCRS